MFVLGILGKELGNRHVSYDMHYMIEGRILPDLKYLPGSSQEPPGPPQGPQGTS